VDREILVPLPLSWRAAAGAVRHKLKHVQKINKKINIKNHKNAANNSGTV
jgi:hypothetical protein